jgi:hypothetical protein
MAAPIKKICRFFHFATPQREALRTLQGQWVRNYSKRGIKGEALQTTCRASLDCTTTPDFLDSTDQKCKYAE